MSDVIRLLPDSVANLIAAGEVIQRPASVVKELVENAVDAGATSIQLIVKDAGRTLVQVIDNGCGMSPTDARMAFERHATSKIVKADDLFSLHTMGFRGEALPTIAAVADIDLRTMQQGESVGTRLLITDGKVESQLPEACVPGTNIMVKNIFYQLPARRKFLKRDAVEMSHIIHEFERLALVNPDVEFTLTHNASTVHKLPRTTLGKRISDLFGKNVGAGLIPVQTDTSLVKISGFVGLPDHARKRNALQYFFVNGRNMRHPYFHRAVMQCYDRLIASDAHPIYFLNFEVDPTTIDVNISPTKNEVKFENEQPIWQILTAAIRESLGRFNAVPAIDFNVDNAPDIPAFDPTNPAVRNDFKIDMDPTYNPFNAQYRSELGGQSGSVAPSSHSGGFKPSSAKSISRDWDKLYDSFSSRAEVSMPDIPAPSALNSPDSNIQQTLALGNTVDGATTVMQLKGRFILSATASGLMVVDQHRAHERVLYDKYLGMIETGEMTSQRLIFPESVDLTASQHVLLESIATEVADMGFDLSSLGGTSWAINGVPASLDSLNPAETLVAIIDDFATTGRDIAEDIHSRIATSMARAAAIKPGQTLTTDEMDKLLSDLLRLATPNYTADGRAVISVIPFDEISKLFV